MKLANAYQPTANYFLNGQDPVNISTSVVSSKVETDVYGSIGNMSTFDYVRYTAQGDAILSNLADGKYDLIIQRYGSPSKPLVSNNVSFTIDSVAPKISILHLENKTYNSDTDPVPLYVGVDEPTSWMGYSLDGQQNITLTENTTISGPTTGLSDGSHSITFYANDTAGNMSKSETVYFTTETTHGTSAPTLTPSPSPTQQPTPTPTESVHRIPSKNYNAIIIVAGLVVAAVVVGLLVYVTKHKGVK